jgi:DNA polymerase-4
MRTKFGKQSDIQAELYWRIANGIDDSPVTIGAHDTQKSIGHQMTLPRDYRTLEEILVVILELAEMVCQHSRAKRYMGWVVSVGLMGADYDRPSGFFRQMRMPDPTNLAEDLYNVAKILIDRHWDKLPVRKVGVTLNDLVDDQEYQYVLFGDRENKMKLARTMDEIKLRYGDASIMRAVSLSKAGQAKDRSKKIGGHYK